MKITESQLRQIIREEVREGARALRKALREAPRFGKAARLNEIDEEGVIR